MNNLNSSFTDFLNDNLPLVIVLAVVLVLIIALVIAMIVIGVKNKKAAAAEESALAGLTDGAAEPAEEAAEEAAEPAEEAPAAQEEAEAPAPIAEAPAEEIPAEEAPAEEPAPAKEAPAEEAPAEEIRSTEEENTMKTEKKPAAKAAPAAKPAAKAAPAAAAAKKPDQSKVSAVNGKWIIRAQGDKWTFVLVANNGETMLTSGRFYGSAQSAKTGIQTYRNNIMAGNLAVVEVKSGDFIFRLSDARGGLLANSSSYRTRMSCESAMESTKRWGATEAIEIVKD